MARPCCVDKSNVKKGLWTEEEDAKILNYIAVQWCGKLDCDPQKSRFVSIKSLHWNTKLKKRLMKMGIDPVTHKPVSQVLSEFRNISGHGNSSFKTEPSNNSILTQSNSAWEMMRNTTTSNEPYYNNSSMIFTSSEFQTTPFFSSHSNHLINGTTSSCKSSSSSASITQNAAVRTSNSRPREHVIPQAPLWMKY